MRPGGEFWLTLTDAVLGLLVVAAVLYVLSEPFWTEFAKVRKRRAYRSELNRDMQEMFGIPARPGYLRALWRRLHDRR